MTHRLSASDHRYVQKWCLSRFYLTGMVRQAKGMQGSIACINRIGVNAVSAEYANRIRKLVQRHFTPYDASINGCNDALYQLGYSGQWDSNAYFVGYRIARAIDQYNGRDRLRHLQLLPPEEFVLDYADICKAHPEDATLPVFAGATIDAARALHEVRMKMIAKH